MFTEKEQPTSLSGIELDRYLSNGWYRMGQTIFTCHFLFFEDNLHSPVWIRLPLKGYQFRKSLRKIKRNIESQFRVEIRPGEIDPFKEELYQRYRQNFSGNIAPTLLESLQDNRSVNIYTSNCIEVYHSKKLIAFSFFDVGLSLVVGIIAYFMEYYDYPVSPILLALCYSLERRKSE